MKKEELPICDHDPFYAEHLADYLNRQRDFPYLVIPFSSMDSLRSYLQKKKADVLVLDEVFQGEAAGSLFEEIRVISLLEDGEREDGVGRYQSCEELCRGILLRCGGLSGRNAGESGEKDQRDRSSCAVYGVYSPVNRCGKTIFAVILGMILTEQKRTLYINLENYHGLGKITGEGEGPDLSDVIYRLRMDGEEGAVQVLGDAVIRWDGVDCLKPAFTSYDLQEVTQEEWRHLLELVHQRAGYEAVVLDIGSQVCEVFSLLEQCDRFFVPVLNDRISRAKADQFEANLEALRGGDLRERMRQVVVPGLRSDSELADFPRQLLRGRIGSYVRSVAATEHL